MKTRAPLRTRYDLPIGLLERDDGSRGMVFREIPAGSRVLDVGCDTGRFGAYLIERKGCLVEGIEADPAAAEEARTRLHRVIERRLHGEDDFRDLGPYDVVTFLDVLEHLVDPWSCLRGALEVLTDEGTVAVVVPNVAHLAVVRRLLAGRFEYGEQGTMDRTHLRWFTRRTLAQSLEAAGFADVRLEVIPVVPYLGRLPGGGRLGRWMTRLFPDQLGGSIVAFARRRPVAATRSTERSGHE